MTIEDYAFLDEYPQTKDDRLPLWKPADTKLEPKAAFVSGGPAPAGSCEFVGELCYGNSVCRRCRVDSGACFHFADRSVYAFCPTRTKKLRELKRERT